MTAVNWMIDELLKRHSSTLGKEYIEIFEQAKEMEKQQILDAFTKGADDGYDGIYDTNKEQYYNETYGSKGSDATSSQTENKGLDWLVSHWKKLKSEGEKMNWEQIIQITELAKDVPSSQTISDEEIEKGVENAWSDYEYKEGNLYSTTFRDGWLMGIDWYKKQLNNK